MRVETHLPLVKIAPGTTVAAGGADSASRGSFPELARADPLNPLECGAERERAAVADLAGEQGMPADMVEALTAILTTVLDGRGSFLTDGVRRALGREPRDFADYARDAAATGVWDPS